MTMALLITCITPIDSIKFKWQKHLKPKNIYFNYKFCMCHFVPGCAFTPPPKML